jgi:hypothetical protein
VARPSSASKLAGRIEAHPREQRQHQHSKKLRLFRSLEPPALNEDSVFRNYTVNHVVRYVFERKQFFSWHGLCEGGPDNGVDEMKNYSFKAAVAVAALIAGSLAFAGTANATATILGSSQVGGAPGGATLDNLDWLSTGTAGGTNGVMSVSFQPDGQAVQGASSGLYAPPFLSGNNGDGFGSPNQALGADATIYVTAGGQTNSNVTFTFSTDESFFGLLWGSIDDYNVLTFYDENDNVIGVIDGLDVDAAANGNQSQPGTYYVNILTDTPYRKVVATSSQHAFEIDNISYNPTNPNIPTPEPITLSLFGAGLAGLGLSRRRRKA